MSTVPLVAVYIVTHRRPAMFRRALASVLAQTHSSLLVRVVNDDPEDETVIHTVEEADDPRVSLFEPVIHRGATTNFNLMFEETQASYASLLEDDNWWEPTFIEAMLATLSASPQHAMVVGNERVWRELPDGQWRDTGQTLWPISDVRTHHYRPEEICGSAKLCNSAMLVRLDAAATLRTPDEIPVDVTEHFRERLLGPRLLLNGSPLVNHPDTLDTARSKKGVQWSLYQNLLIGSVFIAASTKKARKELAARLWSDCQSPVCPRAVTLVAAGLSIREARALIPSAPKVALARCALWAARRPAHLVSLIRSRQSHRSELKFLVEAPLTRHLAETLA